MDDETGAHGRPEIRRHALLLAACLLLVLGGSALAWWIRTDGGRVEIRDVRFTGADGTRLSALLYVPPGATRRSPAPGILAVHGYINSRETQSPFAIELARRGYVVLALDQTGHGFSDPPAFAHGFGGPDGLRHLRSLDFVDPENVGLEGHSMGGWAVLSAAETHPDGYRSVVLLGSSTGSFGTAEGTPEFPRNLELVFSRWDEFSATMWGSPVAADVVETEKLQALFGTDRPVEPGRVYGDLASGTARRLSMPRTTHPGDHLSRAAVARTVEWMERTLEGGRPLPAGDQIWYWKELGTLLALLGLAAGLFPAGALLLRSSFFAGLLESPPPSRGASGAGWWSAAALTAAVPVLTYFPLQNLGSEWIPANAIWPQSITTGITVWALGNALLTLALLVVWHRTAGRRKGARLRDYGLAPDGIGRSALLALVLAGVAYGMLACVHALLGVDFRFWVVALKPMSSMHLRIALAYLPAFLAFFLVLGAALHGQLRSPGAESARDGGSPTGGGPQGSPGGPARLARPMLRNAALLSGGFLVLLAVQYVPLLAGRSLPLGQPLLTIVAFQFVPLLAFVGLVSTFFFRLTGRIWAGAVLNALVVTWYVVAGQATHFPLG